MTDKMQKALRHIETAVDVDEWTMYTVKECFEKLARIEDYLDDCCLDDSEILQIIRGIVHK